MFYTDGLEQMVVSGCLHFYRKGEENMSENPLLSLPGGKKIFHDLLKFSILDADDENCSAILATSLWNLEKWLEEVVHKRNCWRQLRKPASAVQKEYHYCTGLDWPSILPLSCCWTTPPAAISSGMSMLVGGTSGMSIWGWTTSAFVGHTVAGEVNTKPFSGQKQTLKLTAY